MIRRLLLRLVRAVWVRLAPELSGPEHDTIRRVWGDTE